MTQKSPAFEVDVEALAFAQEWGVAVLDVREPSEYATGHVPGARLIPTGELRSRHYEVQRGATVHPVCANGARSLDLISFRRTAGYDAYCVAGGRWAWRPAGGRIHD